MTKIEFIIPLNNLNKSTHQEAELKAKEAYIMTLLKYGEISSGKAGKLLGLGISRLEVLDLMSKYDISPFDDSMNFDDFQSEVNKAKTKLGIVNQ